MPVSKKRKKDGKPVRPHVEPAPEGGEHPPLPDAKPAHLRDRMGAPRNPFVAQQPQHRGAQRGR
jgi:hypothetical protein